MKVRCEKIHEYISFEDAGIARVECMSSVKLIGQLGVIVVGSDIEEVKQEES